MLIEQPPNIFRVLTPDGIFRIPSGDERNIYLTFDDGPIPEVTPWVLDTLDRYRVKATFFMVGDNVRKYPEVYKEVVRRGHRVGNHTMHHLKGLETSTGGYLRDIREAEEFIDSDLFRPPHGWLRPRQGRSLASRYKIIMYDLVTRDYSKRVNARQVVENVKKYTRPGSIIVFHDSIKSHAKLKTALPESIEWLLEQGYSFKLL